jgi:LPS O-antigen subunit length determinant protein (WzzB/FepE family)
LVEAQKKLDEFIQLQRADERLFTELLGAVGVSRTQFDAALDTVTTVAKGVDDTFAKINQLKKAS